MSRLMRAYETLDRVPLGRHVFSLGYRVAAPYFLTIPATVVDVGPGRAQASMWPAPWIRNHLGTVHAIALCNLAEFTMGAVAEATVPPTHRWIPKGMDVAYTGKARGTMRAVATVDLGDLPAAGGIEVPVAISIGDPDGIEVCRATIRIWITPRR